MEKAHAEVEVDNSQDWLLARFGKAREPPDKHRKEFTQNSNHQLRGIICC